MAHNAPPQNFNCDSCAQHISPTNPRIHCLACRDYDLCANCAIGDRFTNEHSPSHPVHVYKESGGINGHQPVLSQNVIVYSQAFQSPPGSLPNNRGPPPLPSRAGAPSGNYTAHNSPVPPTLTRWQPFFLPDMSPTPTYTTLLNDIFTYLDPSNLGYLVPEVFSRFLDDMGYPPHDNAWKVGLTPTFGLSAEFMADKSLKNAFDLFSIDHILHQRVQPAHVSPTDLTSQFQRVLGSVLQSSPATSQGPMPSITRKGFIYITTIEALSYPSREWGNFSRLLKKYNLPRYRNWGDLPRSVLPDQADPGMVQRVAGVMAFSKEQGERDLAAAQAKAAMVARGEQAALDLIDDRRYYRYY